MGKFGETVVSDYCLCGSVDGSSEGWVPFVKRLRFCYQEPVSAIL